MGSQPSHEEHGGEEDAYDSDELHLSVAAAIAKQKAEWKALRRKKRSDDPAWIASFIADDERLIRVTYTSRLLAPDAVTAHSTISTICRQAMQTNPMLRIGGALSYDEASSGVVQEIEGPESTVRWLFAKISKDDRHERVLVVREVDVASEAQREHSGFGMSFGKQVESHQAMDAPADVAYARLVYTSLLCARGSAAAALLASIVRASAQNNPRLRIGGELLHNVETSQVVQVLEGPDGAVRALYSTIERDLRHEHVSLISDETIAADARRYAQWGMSASSVQKSPRSDWGTELTARLGDQVRVATANALQRWRRHARNSRERWRSWAPQPSHARNVGFGTIMGVSKRQSPRPVFEA